MAEQAIIAEQRAIREELQQLTKRIENKYKGEIQRLMSRLEEQDACIAKLQNGGGASQADFQAPRNRGLDTPGARNSLSGGYGGYPAARSGLEGRGPTNGPIGRSPTSQPPMSPSPASPNFQGYSSSPRVARKSEDDLLSIKRAATAAVSGVGKTQAWEEPGEYKVSSAAIDRFESQLKNAFERNREFQKYYNNPIQGTQALFRRLDKNHSGKVDAVEMLHLSKILELEADETLMGALFKRYDLDHTGLLTVDEFSRALFKLDGDIEMKAKSAVARMREVLAMRAGGYETLRALYRQFRIMDRDHTSSLSKDEWNIALDILFSAYNVKFSPAEKNALFTMFDMDKSGSVNYDEFVRGVRGDMNDFRVDWVKQAFRILDKDGSGVIDLNEIASVYDVSHNPAVQGGKTSPQQAFGAFLAHWDSNQDGRVTFEEFLDNYQWVSASIDSDDYFELMMRNAWHITGGEGWCANTSNLRVLVKHSTGKEEVVCLNDDFALPRDEGKMYSEVVRRLKEQGVKDIKKVEFCG